MAKKMPEQSIFYDYSVIKASHGPTPFTTGIRPDTTLTGHRRRHDMTFLNPLGTLAAAAALKLTGQKCV